MYRLIVRKRFERVFADLNKETQRTIEVIELFLKTSAADYRTFVKNQ